MPAISSPGRGLHGRCRVAAGLAEGLKALGSPTCASQQFSARAGTADASSLVVLCLRRPPPRTAREEAAGRPATSVLLCHERELTVCCFGACIGPSQTVLPVRSPVQIILPTATYRALELELGVDPIRVFRCRVGSSSF